MTPLPDHLYHYTTTAGLLGIITTGTLWATDYRFLNDEAEVVYARERFLDALSAIENPALRNPQHVAYEHAEAFGRDFDRYISVVKRELQELNHPAYVACFCEADDLLSQWRAYGAQGCSIELDTERLANLLSRAFDWLPSMGDFIWGGLSQVRYGVESADDILALVRAQVEADTNLGMPGTHGYFMADRMVRAMAQIKDPSFIEEREWRLVMSAEVIANAPPREGVVGSVNQVRMRITKVGLAPYIAITLPRKAITGVRVGPGPQSHTRAMGVKRLLEQYGIVGVDTVRTSTAPLR